MKLFAVGCFFFGVVALGALVERRRRKVVPAWPDYALTFIGLGGVITGLILLFNRLE